MAGRSLKVAVVGSGIAGLSCSWLLSRQHKVTLYEKDDRFGGHSHTVTIEGHNGSVPVDTGFIVYNEKTYKNLTAFFQHLNVPVEETDMSFAVSLDKGRVEYAGTDLNALFAQRRNLLNPGFWKMLTDLLRFYRSSPAWEKLLTPTVTLRELLEVHKFGKAFIHSHLVPMGAAIWSTPAEKMLDYPALAFLRFCQNHGLLQLTGRPQWMTVKGGSREYVQRIVSQIKDAPESASTLQNSYVRQVKRYQDKVVITDMQGREQTYDHVVMACHADTSLRLLAEPDELEQLLLGSFQFQRNRAILHSDSSFMPRRQVAWASWNYLHKSEPHKTSKSGRGNDTGPSVTYWMNKLQNIDDIPLFVTLNPDTDPKRIHGSYLYDHPVFDTRALEAQQRLWELQGRHRTWFCGAWFGYGFHEDGLQSGLAVAEALGGQRRPWRVDGENDRIVLPETMKVPAPIKADAGMDTGYGVYS